IERRLNALDHGDGGLARPLVKFDRFDERTEFRVRIAADPVDRDAGALYEVVREIALQRKLVLVPNAGYRRRVGASQINLICPMLEEVAEVGGEVHRAVAIVGQRDESAQAAAELDGD